MPITNDGIILNANQVEEYTPDTDKIIQVKNQSSIYFTDDNSKKIDGWFCVKSLSTIILASGITYYFWCKNDNILAEIGM